MKTYNVNVSFSGFFRVEVEAKTEEDARKKIEKQFERLLFGNEETDVEFNTMSCGFSRQGVCLYNGQIDDILKK